MQILNKLIEKEDLEKYIKLRSNFIESLKYTQDISNKDYEIRLSELKNLKEWLVNQ